MRFSVILASRGRPAELLRTLQAIRQLDHSDFEVVVVADPTSLAALSEDWFRTVPFDEPNLSKARNAGIEAAAGDTCAFIDDDAVPEPLWLQHHEAALAATGAVASVGFVRGRNGIGFQSRVASINREAETHQEDDRGDAPFVPVLAKGRALKLIGTNMVVRRQTLAQLGGFDPAYRYFLEDSDLSLRLSIAGLPVAVAPLAEVHHAFSASDRRTAHRAPLSLYDIGRSTAVFLRRHPRADFAEIADRLRARERKRLLDHMIRGTCEPGAIPIVLRTLEHGWSDGTGCSLPDLSDIAVQKDDFRRVERVPEGHRVIAARLVNRRRAMREARDITSKGNARVTVLSYSLTAVRHVVRYTDGYWLHTGGQFGRVDGSGKRLMWCRFARRVADEIARVAKQRGI